MRTAALPCAVFQNPCAFIITATTQPSGCGGSRLICKSKFKLPLTFRNSSL